MLCFSRGNQCLAVLTENEDTSVIGSIQHSESTFPITRKECIERKRPHRYNTKQISYSNSYTGRESILRTTGQAKNGLYVTGFAWSPAYLLDGNPPVIFEAGFFCMGRFYEKDIGEVLAHRAPAMLFLTHVHYDHCGAAGYFKRCFHGLDIAASKRAAEIMERRNALNLMATLSRNVTGIISDMKGVDHDLLIREPFEPFSIDRVLRDGDIIELSDNTHIHVMETPGHTRDMLSYYIPEKKILISTESAGVMDQNGHIVTEFLVDFDAYITSLQRLAALDIDVFCPGHHYVFTGEEVQLFFKNSLDAAQSFRERVEGLLGEANGSVDYAVSVIKSEEYDTNPGPKQPEMAYLINLRTRVEHLAKRWSEGKNLSL